MIKKIPKPSEQGDGVFRGSMTTPLLSPVRKGPPNFNKELLTEGNPAHIDKDVMQKSFAEAAGGKIVTD